MRSYITCSYILLHSESNHLQEGIWTHLIAAIVLMLQVGPFFATENSSVMRTDSSVALVIKFTKIIIYEMCNSQQLWAALTETGLLSISIIQK